MSQSVGAPRKITPEERLILSKDDLGPLVIGISTGFAAFALVTVGLRIFARARMTKLFGTEDYLMIAAMLFSIGHTVAQVYQVSFGAGKHLPLLVFEQSIGLRKCLYTSIVMYFASLTCTKLSILFQYRRIFSIGYMRIGIYGLMAFCAAFGIEGILTSIFTCIPVKAFWLVWLKIDAKCVNENDLYFANAALGIATDFLVAILPIHAIWQLQMPNRQKIALMLLLGLGIFVSAVGVIRLQALIYLSKHRDDASYYSGRTAYWTAIEVNLAIFCGSAPSLKPLIVRIFPVFASRLTRGSSGGSLPSFVKPGTSRWRFAQLSKSRRTKSSTHASGHTRPGDEEQGGGLDLKDLGNLTALPHREADTSRPNMAATREDKMSFDQRSRSVAPSDHSSHDDLVRGGYGYR
ncbi:hypothetical protein M011DRAFT_481289 [Sporormia fimetaria CBS 119925]|uniref:Rhodopsin domain-containing protein n=1 Tax=Sporormia fimetaria CBS 119925 TaxID=1340428 RepID=A0A6A6UYK1_9PLEO|nr:hypothetical protein M011DRAFT_481289 [Sporormia fimetaria CBS 119925]